MSKQQEPNHRRLPTDISFYNDRPPMKDSARRLLTEYSHIPEDQIDSHVEDIRQRAFKIFPYPCIGMIRFLELSILTQSVYNDVLDRVKNGAKFLDLGCCFGQEIRQLVLDGAPPENLYGSDLQPDFISLGYDLFKDQATLKTKFMTADILDANSPLSQLNGQLGIVYTGSFFHLFNYDQQVTIAKRVVELLDPVKGSMLIGRQAGSEQAGASTIESPGVEQAPYRHNVESWKAFWKEIGKQTNSEWDVQIDWDSNWVGFTGSDKESSKVGGEVNNIRRMAFVVTRM